MNPIRYVSILPGLILAVVSGCSGPEPAPPAARAGMSAFRPTATIKDIMDAVVDPSADAIWESVETVVDLEGVHEYFPETDEEWAEVRRHAIRVLEASNLLLIPGREVAPPGTVSEFPEIELGPAEVQEIIDQDWNTFVGFAHGLHDQASITLAAIDARDTEALLASGEGLDRACEQCHLHYWYPNDSAARAQFEENERLRLEAEGSGEAP